jgi:hypothetical protein
MVCCCSDHVVKRTIRRRQAHLLECPAQALRKIFNVLFCVRGGINDPQPSPLGDYQFQLVALAVESRKVTNVIGLKVTFHLR